MPRHHGWAGDDTIRSYVPPHRSSPSANSAKWVNMHSRHLVLFTNEWLVSLLPHLLAFGGSAMWRIVLLPGATTAMARLSRYRAVHQDHPLHGTTTLLAAEDIATSHDTAAAGSPRRQTSTPRSADSSPAGKTANTITSGPKTTKKSPGRPTTNQLRTRDAGAFLGRLTPVSFVLKETSRRQFHMSRHTGHMSGRTWLVYLVSAALTLTFFASGLWPQIASPASAQVIMTGTAADSINAKWLALAGTKGVLGPAVSDVQTFAVAGAQVRYFQNGAIIWSAGTGAHDVYGEIFRQYTALPTYSRSQIGLPISGETDGFSSGSRMNRFQNGAIIWSAGTGAHDVYGAIMARYTSLGNAVATLGLPTSGEKSAFGGRMNTFTGGHITWNAGTGQTTVTYYSNLRHPRTGQPFYPNVIRWAPTASHVLADTNIDLAYLPGVLAQVQQESAGNPNAVNDWDSNWRAGIASFGLLQTIAPTYQRYAPPGQRGQLQYVVVNGVSQQYVPEMVVPYNNLYAGINYAISVYGVSRLELWRSGVNQAFSVQ